MIHIETKVYEKESEHIQEDGNTGSIICDDCKPESQEERDRNRQMSADTVGRVFSRAFGIDVKVTIAEETA